MDDEAKNSVHLFIGETICCGLEVIDVINSYKCDGGIAIVSQVGNMRYAAVRYVTVANLCNCSECLAICNNAKVDVPQEASIMVQALMSASDRCTDYFV